MSDDKNQPVSDSLGQLTQRLREFTGVRDWRQFNCPKNLVMALTGEAGELAAEFQWLTLEQSEAPEPERLVRIQAETADVLVYLVQLADRLGFDLIEAANAKIDRNEERYPADKVRGSAKKYNEY